MEETAEISVGVALDGTVCAATPQGTVIVQLAGATAGRPEIVTSMQVDLASGPVELARYPLRALLALALYAMRARRRGRRRETWQIVAGLPRQLRRAQRLALSQFVGVNFDALMLAAHAASALRASRFRRWPALLRAFPTLAA